MTQPSSAMVLAAGFGTRMGDLTKTRPKPLLPVSGRTLIDRSLDLLEEAGVPSAVINLHYLGDMIRDHLGDRISPDIAFSAEDPILETGGGVVKALPLLGKAPFITLNSDAVFAGPNPIATLTEAWNTTDAEALLLFVSTANAYAYTRSGDFFLDSDGAHPRRRGSADHAPFVYAGAQIISPDALRGYSEEPFSMNLVWDQLLAKGRLRAVCYPGQWVDVGTPEGLAQAEQVLGSAAE